MHCQEYGKLYWSFFCYLQISSFCCDSLWFSFLLACCYFYYYDFNSSVERFLVFVLSCLNFHQQSFFCKDPNQSCFSTPSSPLGETPGEITLSQVCIKCKHFPKDYTPDKSLHFSTWFITEYIVCLHMQEQITRDLYIHND